MLVSELSAIREVQFAKGAVVTDLGPTNTGDPMSLASSTGAIGVQP